MFQYFHFQLFCFKLPNHIGTPIPGPQPDWDPDIVAALERVEVTSDPEEEEELEDDFVLMVTLLLMY